MNDPETTEFLEPRPRPSEIVELSVPLDTLSMLRRVAEARDLSVQGLLKLYVGQALRKDYDSRFPGEAASPAVRPPVLRHGNGAGD